MANLIDLIFDKWKPHLHHDSYENSKWTVDRGVRYSEKDGVRSIVATGTAGHEDRYKPITLEELVYILNHGESTYYTRFKKAKN